MNLLKRVRWTVTARYRNTPAGDAFSSLEKVLDIPVPERPVTSDSESVVFRHSVAGTTYYVKRFHLTKGLRSWLGFSRLRGEWNNLKLFAKLGLPAAQLVAYGEQRCLTWAGQGVLITQELPNTEDLAHLAIHGDARLKDAAWVRAVSTQVANAARCMHQHRFAHNDFKWRNILVDGSQEHPQIYLIDCPTGQRWFGPFLKYRIIKDLACLDKVASCNLSRSQRLRFFKDYRQIEKLTNADKEMIRRIVLFFKGRE